MGEYHPAPTRVSSRRDDEVLEEFGQWQSQVCESRGCQRRCQMAVVRQNGRFLIVCRCADPAHVSSASISGMLSAAAIVVSVIRPAISGASPPNCRAST
jgi:hypothetical protein